MKLAFRHQVRFQSGEEEFYEENETRSMVLAAELVLEGEERPSSEALPPSSTTTIRKRGRPKGAKNRPTIDNVTLLPPTNNMKKRGRPTKSSLYEGGFKDGSIKRLVPSAGGLPGAARQSQGVISDGVVYLSSQRASDTNVQSVVGQAAQIFKIIDGLLHHARTDKKHILHAHVFLSHIAYAEEFNRAWESWIDPEHLPARSLVEGRLIRPEYMVEVQITAVVPRPKALVEEEAK